MTQTPRVRVLEKYNTAFRELVNTKIRRAKETEKVHAVLKLSTPEDWDFICTAMDIIGDTCGAVEHFLRFGLSGPTKYKNTGEQFLRLYGILNAAYLQQEAIYNLYKLSGLPNPTDVNNKIGSLKIRDARYKLGSDSNGYKNPKSGNIEPYISIPMEVADFSVGCHNNITNKNESFDLKECLEAHLQLMIELYNQIYETAIDTHFKSPKKTREGFLEELSDLQLIRDGGIVSNNGGIKIRMAAPIIVTNKLEDEHRPRGKKKH